MGGDERGSEGAGRENGKTGRRENEKTGKVAEESRETATLCERKQANKPRSEGKKWNFGVYHEGSVVASWRQVFVA